MPGHHQHSKKLRDNLSSSDSSSNYSEDEGKVFLVTTPPENRLSNNKVKQKRSSDKNYDDDDNKHTSSSHKHKNKNKNKNFFENQGPMKPSVELVKSQAKTLPSATNNPVAPNAGLGALSLPPVRFDGENNKNESDGNDDGNNNKNITDADYNDKRNEQRDGNVSSKNAKAKFRHPDPLLADEETSNSSEDEEEEYDDGVENDLFNNDNNNNDAVNRANYFGEIVTGKHSDSVDNSEIDALKESAEIFRSQEEAEQIEEQINDDNVNNNNNRTDTFLNDEEGEFPSSASAAAAAASATTRSENISAHHRNKSGETSEISGSSDSKSGSSGSNFPGKISERSASASSSTSTHTSNKSVSSSSSSGSSSGQHRRNIAQKFQGNKTATTTTTTTTSSSSTTKENKYDKNQKLVSPSSTKKISKEEEEGGFVSFFSSLFGSKKKEEEDDDDDDLDLEENYDDELVVKKKKKNRKIQGGGRDDAGEGEGEQQSEEDSDNEEEEDEDFDDNQELTTIYEQEVRMIPLTLRSQIPYSLLYADRPLATKVLLFVFCAFAGLYLGALLFYSGVIIPDAMHHVWSFQSGAWVIMKFIIARTGTAMICNSYIEWKWCDFFNRTRMHWYRDHGYVVTLIGMTVYAVGLELGGVVPFWTFAMVGAGIHETWLYILGHFIGVLCFVPLERKFDITGSRIFSQKKKLPEQQQQQQVSSDEKNMTQGGGKNVGSRKKQLFNQQLQILKKQQQQQKQEQEEEKGKEANNRGEEAINSSMKKKKNINDNDNEKNNNVANNENKTATNARKSFFSSRTTQFSLLSNVANRIPHHESESFKHLFADFRMGIRYHKMVLPSGILMLVVACLIQGFVSTARDDKIALNAKGMVGPVVLAGIVHAIISSMLRFFIRYPFSFGTFNSFLVDRLTKGSLRLPNNADARFEHFLFFIMMVLCLACGSLITALSSGFSYDKLFPDYSLVRFFLGGFLMGLAQNFCGGELLFLEGMAELQISSTAAVIASTASAIGTAMLIEATM